MRQPQNEQQKSKQGRISSLGCLAWGIWAGLVLIFGQSTWSSMYENETRAATIYATFTGLLVIGGVIVYFSRRYNNL